MLCGFSTGDTLLLFFWKFNQNVSVILTMQTICALEVRATQPFDFTAAEEKKRNYEENDEKVSNANVCVAKNQTVLLPFFSASPKDKESCHRRSNK